MDLCPFSKDCSLDQLRQLNKNVLLLKEFIRGFSGDVEAYTALMCRISEALNLVEFVSKGLQGNFNELLRQFEDKKDSAALEKMTLWRYIVDGTDSHIVV